MKSGGFPMFQQVRQFMSTFRELENQELPMNREDKERGERLRQILSTTVESISNTQPPNRYIVAVASFYSQAGASFIAGNLAYHQAGKGKSVILCELPTGNPYYYFALDSEERAEASMNQGDLHDEKIITMQAGCLRVKANVPYMRENVSYPEVTSWLLGNSRNASLLIIDISSGWKEEAAAWIMDMADEIWFVLDSDIPRFARTILTEEAPKAWNTSGKKVRLIANKWSQAHEKEQLKKRIEGTLSFWSLNQKNKRVDMLVPAIINQKIMNTHDKAQFLLEAYPEEEEAFARLATLLEE